MSDFKKLGHAVWQCKYHVVWCPKYRFQILEGKVGRAMQELLEQLCEWKKIDWVEGNVQKDHVHLVLGIPPKYAVSEVVGLLKGKSAVKMFDLVPSLRKRYWGRHFWSRGYCVSTVGLNEEQIRKYVRWQLQKDQNMEQLSLWNE